MFRLSMLLCAALASFSGICAAASSKNGVVTNNQIQFNYQISNGAHTSAGVFGGDGSLVRTLWSNQWKDAGSYSDTWDAHDDLGNVAPTDTYEIRVLLNNVQYEWGVIGDSSSSWNGPQNWDSQSTMPRDMVIAGSNAITGNGYSEARSNSSIFDWQHPQEASAFFSFRPGCVTSMRLWQPTGSACMPPTWVRISREAFPGYSQWTLILRRNMRFPVAGSRRMARKSADRA